MWVDFLNYRAAMKPVQTAGVYFCISVIVAHACSCCYVIKFNPLYTQWWLSTCTLLYIGGQNHCHKFRTEQKSEQTPNTDLRASSTTNCALYSHFLYLSPLQVYIIIILLWYVCIIILSVWDFIGQRSCDLCEISLVRGHVTCLFGDVIWKFQLPVSQSLSRR